MQEFEKKELNKEVLRIKNISLEDKQKLVGVFAWLIREDKKTQYCTLLDYKKQKK